jgi:hypothetical protein
MEFQADAQQEPATFMPVVDWQMTGLEVRDPQNQIVSDAAAIDALRSLFTGNLYNLVAQAPLHTLQQAWADIEYFSRLFKDAFFNVVLFVSRAILAALGPPQKLFVHNVHNLWIAFSVAVLLASALFRFSFAKTPPQQIILRI